MYTSNQEDVNWDEIIQNTHIADYDTKECCNCGATTNVVLHLCEDCFDWDLSLLAKKGEGRAEKFSRRCDEDPALWPLAETNEYFRREVHYRFLQVGPPRDFKDDPEVWSLNDPLFYREIQEIF